MFPDFSFHCSNSLRGMSNCVAITPDGNLALTDVDDLCVQRKIEFRGSLIDREAQHQTGTLLPYSP